MFEKASPQKLRFSTPKAQRDRILELISKKKDNELERLSVEELTSKLNEYL